MGRGGGGRTRLWKKVPGGDGNRGRACGGEGEEEEAENVPAGLVQNMAPEGVVGKAPNWLHGRLADPYSGRMGGNARGTLFLWSRTGVLCGAPCGFLSHRRAIRGPLGPLFCSAARALIGGCAAATTLRLSSRRARSRNIANSRRV